MSYNVTINGQTTETTSYAAAGSVVKEAVTNAAQRLATPIRNGLYRSPKATARINADRERSAAKLLAGVKLPKTAGDVSGRVPGVSYAIARK